MPGKCEPPNPSVTICLDAEPLRTKMDPLEYLLAVMNSPSIEPERRDKAAIAAAPYMHERADSKGKKLGKKEQQKEAAATALAGRFSTGSTPANVIQISK